MMKGVSSNPLLSVIVPIYNIEDYVGRCIDSITAQTYRNLEIILVDDGSTDRSGAIADGYARRDDRIKVIHKENGGLVSARKAGISAAAGEYAAYVDGDDWIEPKMYEDLLALAVKEDAEIVTSGDIRDYGTHSIESPEYVAAGAYRGTELLQLKEKLINTDCFYQANISIKAYNKLFKREYLQKYQLRINDRICLGEDAALIYPAMFHADCCVVSGQNYYHYCIRADSIMGALHKSRDLDEMGIMISQLRKDFGEAACYVPNVMKQFHMFDVYTNLLCNTEGIIRYKDNVLYPFGVVEKNTKAAIYGAGVFGRALKGYLDKTNFFQIVGVFDKITKEGILPPSELKNTDFDFIIIAVLFFDVREGIKKELKEQGIREEQMLCVDVELINN